MAWLNRNWHRVLAHAAALAPLAALAVDYLRDDLSANPVRFLTLRSGSVGLVLLVASLACTPANIVLGWRWAIQLRRLLGLYAVGYISLHLLLYALYDGELDLELILRDLGERRSMAVGMAAYLALAPLAITSTNGWQRRLGRRWRMLHWLAYVASPLSVLHFFWLDRDFYGEPLFYAALVGLLLALRIPPLRRAIVRARRGFRSRAPASQPPADDAYDLTK